MKKTIAVILSVLMLICSIPFTAGAVRFGINLDVPAEGTENVEFITSNITVGKVSDSTLESNTTYVICNGATLTFRALNTCYVPQGTTIYVAEGGTINAEGTLVIDEGAAIIVKKGGTLKAVTRLEVYHNADLYVEGTLRGAENVFVASTANAEVAITFTSLKKTGNEGKVKISYASSKDAGLSEDQTLEFITIADLSKDVVIWAPLNQFFYVKAEIIEDEEGVDKYDDSLFKIYLNEFEIPFSAGSHPFMATSAGEVSYSVWTKPSDFYNTYSIYLPSGEGYAIYGRGGEQWKDGETPKLKHGQAFSFRIEVEPEYDMSAYEVYVYNGYGWINLDPNNGALAGIAPAQPDEYGYYHIDAIKGDTTIYVSGIMKNETLLMIGDILDMVKGIFEMFSGFFQEILGYIGAIFGGGTVA